MGEIKAKIFSYLTTNINPPGELQINAWLAEHPDAKLADVPQLGGEILKGQVRGRVVVDVNA